MNLVRNKIIFTANYNSKGVFRGDIGAEVRRCTHAEMVGRLATQSFTNIMNVVEDEILHFLITGVSNESITAVD